MNIEISQIKMLRISDVPRLDPIRVTLEDIEPSKGRITFESYGRAWSAYWGGMSDRDIAQFFIDMPANYLINNLDGQLPARVFDADTMVQTIKAASIEKAKKDPTIPFEPFMEKLKERLERMSSCQDENDCWAFYDVLEDLYGEEWWRQLDDIAGAPNPQYVYLSNIVAAVKGGLKAMKAQEQEESSESLSPRRPTQKA